MITPLLTKRKVSTIPSSFSPSDISNLELWLDAGDSDTITLVDSKVSQWKTSGLGWTVSGAYRYYELYVTKTTGTNDNVALRSISLAGPHG